MSAEITMPKLSDTMEEGTIVRWKVKAGDRVSKGDIVAEVETDKATMEMEAFEEGTVSEIKVEEGNTVAVGTVLAVLSSDDAESEMSEEEVEEDTKEKTEKAAEEKESEPAAKTKKEEKPVASTKEDQAEKESAAVKAKAEASEEAPEKKEKKEFEPDMGKTDGSPERETGAKGDEKERIAVSPAARKLAKEKSISLSGIQGSGPDGRIVLADIEGKGGSGKQSAGILPEGKKEKEVSGNGNDAKAQRVRRVVARKMEESWKNIPHFFVTVAIDVSDAMRFHEDLHVSLNDFILAAVGRALKDHPRVNSLWLEGEAVPQNAVNVAVAVATEEGLYSPVVRDCDRLSLQEIHRRSRELQDKVKNGTIRTEDIENAGFTISNMGMLGVESFTAIITPPQAAALAIGRATPEAVVAANGDFEVVQRMRVTLSADHRILDGADGAAFLDSVKNYLETPLRLIVTVE